MHSNLRPKIIKDHILRHEAAWRRMMAHLHERDSLHQRLNQEHGFIDVDGSYGTGKKTYTNLEYVAKYDATESTFASRYSKEREIEVSNDKKALTIWEFLVVDNASSDVSLAILEAATKNEHVLQFNFVKLRARVELSDWKLKYSVGGIIKMISNVDRDFHQRASRCRKVLGLSWFNLGATMAISRFNATYVGELREGLNALEVND